MLTYGIVMEVSAMFVARMIRGFVGVVNTRRCCCNGNME